MKLIYIAGPYSAVTEKGVQENIRIAEKYAVMLADIGIGFICPHKNTANFHNLSSAPYNYFIKLGLEILEKCDAILVIPNYENSKGTLIEMELAKRYRKPIFYPKSLDDSDVFDAILKFAKEE